MKFIAVTEDDAAVLVEFLSRQYLPPAVSAARDRLVAASELYRERWDLVDTGLGPSMVPKADGRFVKVSD